MYSLPWLELRGLLIFFIRDLRVQESTKVSKGETRTRRDVFLESEDPYSQYCFKNPACFGGLSPSVDKKSRNSEG